MTVLASQKELDCRTRLRTHSIQAEVEKPGCSFWQSHILDTISLVKFIASAFGAQRWTSRGRGRWDTGCKERRRVQLPLELKSWVKSLSKLTNHSRGGNSWLGPSHVNLHIQLTHAYRMIVLIFFRFHIWSVSGLWTISGLNKFASLWFGMGWDGPEVHCM